ncbi:MAG: response regulator transcription factor [Peptococcaceae bacterium]|nr:response regulator transcription factor [Peptococcaceae bacterium]
MIRVLIAEDEPLFRDGLRRILESDEEIHVCGLAANGREAYALCMDEKPDVVLMDMRMPKGNGDIVAKRIKEAMSETKVVILTVFDDRVSVAAAHSSGIDGFLVKGVGDKEIINAVKGVFHGVSVVSAKVYDMIKSNIYGVKLPNNMTPKEIKILALLGKGKSNGAIAETLYCSKGSIRNDMTRLLAKFGFEDRFELGMYAIRNGLDEWDEGDELDEES